MSGFFITLDGIDGAGKSTHLAFMQTWLEEHGVDAMFTREPGGTPLGENLRGLLLDPAYQPCADTETLLMFAARAQHLHEVIRPALADNRWVVSDRFTDATFAYQCGGRGIAAEKIALLENWVQDDLRPDMTIILDVPLEVSLARIEKSRDKDRFEQEPADFFTRVRAAYLQRAAEHPQRYAVVRSDRELEAVKHDIAAILSGCLNTWRTRSGA
ncbi:MAG: dTMP kinase [Neisseria sp.]|nr:dTMP kinase [Neisseria sp.]